MTVKTFLETENLFEVLADNKAAADALVQPWQAGLKKGDCFCYMSHEMGFIIWGKVLEDQEDPVMAGYRFCKCFSVVSPEGEMGDVHVSVIHRKVTPAVFNRARSAGWPHDEVTFTKFAALLKKEKESN